MEGVSKEAASRRIQSFQGAGSLDREQFVNKFHEHTLVLEFQVLYPKTPIFFTAADTIPSHKAFGTVTAFITSPKESPTTLINGLNYRFGNIHS